MNNNDYTTIAGVPEDEPKEVRRFANIEQVLPPGSTVVPFRPREKSEQRVEPKTPLAFVNMSSWDESPVPEREWAVRKRIPIRQVTSLAGEGAVGKSILELQLASAHVLGRDWLGSLPEPGRAIYLGCEDEADELHRRLADVCAHYKVTFSSLSRDLHLLSYVDRDALLAMPDRSGRMVPTQLYERLLEAAGDIKPKHIGIDTQADTFGGNELDRSQVRQYIALLRKLAITANGSVVLLNHPSLTGISTGTGLSGSTGWHNSVRGRIYMRKADDDPELRVIDFLKNQYGPCDDRITVRYQNGVFVPDDGKSSTKRAAEDAKADSLFLELLALAAGQHRYFGAKPGTSYAPARLAEMSQAHGTPSKVLAAAMERLFAANKIKLIKDPTKKESKATMVVVFA
jgi:RecA-family ATPase